MNPLLRALRPGSRTVVCQPAEAELLLQMARHGFRLMIVHRDEEFLRETRTKLGSLGLSSQLMGSTRAEADQVPSLARNFYEAVLLCEASKITPESMLFALETGGALIWENRPEINLSGLNPLKLPPGYAGGRLP